MNVVEEIEDFFGVYLLVSKSLNPKFAGRTYVGYTVDPNRRIKQHNRGQEAGGARRTSNRGPWYEYLSQVELMKLKSFCSMLFIYSKDNGYDHSWIPEQYICTKGKLLVFTPNGVRIYYDSDLYCKLKFEWAWQQPRVSRRLKQIADVQKKLRNESYFEYNFRILSEMLRIGPWNRLPLIIRWLADEYHREFEVGKTPPLHMPICFGRIKKVNKKRKPGNAVTNTHKAAELQPPKSTASNQATHAKIPINYDLDEFDRIVMGGEKIDDYISQSARRAEVEEANPINSIIISSDSEEENDGVEAIGEESKEECTLCRDSIDTRQLEEGGDIVLRCLQPRCRLVSHLECLAQSVLEPGQYVPVEGDCPICETHFLWGDIIRKANGCSDLVDDVENVDPLEVNEVSDEDQ